MKTKRATAYLFIMILTWALSPHSVHGAAISPTDLNSLNLGAKIVGPVGPTVDASFVNGNNKSLGSIKGSVSCPLGFDICAPANNPAGILYTYVYKITPGVNLPNDPPFPQPALTNPAFDEALRFQLNFAPGSNGIAGFDFTQATNALGLGADFEIELMNDVLTWTVLNGNSDWNTGEAISFFWQTTQPPSGPGNVYEINNRSDTGKAIGPKPTPLTSNVPLPGTLLLMIMVLPYLVWKPRKLR